MIAPNLYVRRHEVRNGRIGTSEHYVFCRGFKIVVDDLQWAGRVIAPERLRIGTVFLEVRNIGIDDRDTGSIHRDAAPPAYAGIAVDIAPIEGNVMRQISQ